ncbi:hypothetical protein ODJ79_11550 [Actinoplanes sp. KI2]|uniref:hypothetical protein n=1 Tax=Actinoplanes sp. KI2 TaxID=2983315 RepID=UPI0021D5D569|nr:hypothetical protein [Actinoplanes sp. KI2]MCU7724352.1 hypothetical protein [Actinoplanes sp. KI2]
MTRASRRAEEDRYAAPWTGAYRRYDLVKEFVAALGVMALLTIVLAAVFSSPDRKGISLAEWARNAPGDFAVTAVAELDGTSGTATYGAPYTDDPTAGQKLGPLPLQRWGGVRHPVDTANDFVLNPLSAVTGNPALTAALGQYRSADVKQQQAWTQAYADALDKAPDNDPAKVAAGDYGPVPVLIGELSGLARSGGLEGQLLTQEAVYQTNYTKPLLFLADGSYLEDQARAEHLGGDQWGMMNETGRYPGQAWLWLYTFWYQIKPFSTSDNADALVWGLMMLLSLGLVLVPFIPGLRALPRRLGVYRLVWRDYYRHRG